MMDLRRLKYFSQVAELQSFTLAAKRLHVAQSALSRHVRSLEQELGTQLFVANGRGVVLTRAGTLLHQHARAILEQVSRAREDVIASESIPRGLVGIGADPSLGHMLFGPLAQRIRSEHPGVTLRLIEGLSYHLEEWLEVGKIDIGILSDPEPSEDLVLTELIREPLYLVASRQSGIRLPPECDFSFVCTVPLITTSGPNKSRIKLERLSVDQNRQLRIVAESEGLQSHRDMVRRDIGLSVLPASALWTEGGNIHQDWKLSRITDISVRRAIALRRNRPLSPAIAHLVHAIRESVAAMVQMGAIEDLASMTAKPGTA